MEDYIIVDIALISTEVGKRNSMHETPYDNE